MLARHPGNKPKGIYPDLYTIVCLYILLTRSPCNFPTTTHCAPSAGAAGDPWTAAKLVPRHRSQTFSPASSCEPPPPNTARRHTHAEIKESTTRPTQRRSRRACVRQDTRARYQFGVEHPTLTRGAFRLDTYCCTVCYATDVDKGTYRTLGINVGWIIQREEEERALDKTQAVCYRRRRDTYPYVSTWGASFNTKKKRVR